MASRKSPKLTRKNSFIKKAISTEDLTLLNQISRQDLDSLECHFNWDICSHVTQATIQEKIHSVSGHLRTNSANILPQSHCLLAYLKSQSSEKTDKETVYNELLAAEISLEETNSLEEIKSKEFVGLGYKAIVIANLVFWESTNLRDHETANVHFKHYQNLCKKFPNKLSEHPEVLAMRAFSLGYSFGHKKSLESIECYEKALGHELYKDKTEWLFGLAHAKSIVASKQDFLVKEDVVEIEQVLRRVIQQDSKHSLAMLKLAKMLINLNGIQCFEEVKYWIHRALEVEPIKINILEEAGSIYLLANRYDKSYNEEAKMLFRKAEKIDPNSKRTVKGLGQVYLNMYFKKKYNQNKRAKGDKNKNAKPQVPHDLNMAKEYFERNVESKRHIEHLKCAHVYHELSKFADKDNYLKKAEVIYKDVMANTEKEKDGLRFLEACFRYSTFLKSQDRIEDDIRCLTNAIAFKFNADDDCESDMRFIRDCQERLLGYTSSKYFNKVESNALKGFVQFQRNNFRSAIFYCRQVIAIQASTKEDTGKENLVRYLLEASQTEHHSCIGHDFYQQCFDEAKDILDGLTNTGKKFDLQFQIIEIEMNKMTEGYDDLMNLKDYRIEFETFFRDINKAKVTKTVTFGEEHQEVEIKHVLNFICEGKRVLDRGMNNVKTSVFNILHDKPPFCYYPCPKNLQITGPINEDGMRKKMENLLQSRYKLTDFRQELPELFEFLVNRQIGTNPQEYKWLQSMIDVRNDNEHHEYAAQLLKDTFPTTDERTQLVRNATKYVIEVYKKFLEECALYKK